MEQEMDIRYLWGVLLARKKYFFWPASILLLLAAIVAMALPPVYESSSTILIEEQQIPQDFVRTTVTGFADQRIQSLNQQILSRTRLLEIIRQFALYQEMQQKHPQEEIVRKMRQDITVNTVSAELSDRRGIRAGGLSGMTIAFTIAYRGRNPDTVQNVAGTLASLYLEENLRIREEQAKTTTQFLKLELQEIKDRIAALGGQISAFKTRHEGALPELQEYNMSQAEQLVTEIMRANAQIAAAEDRRIYLEGQIATVNPDTTLIGPDGERIMDPASRLRYLQVLLLDLQSRYSNSHPDIAKVLREMAELERLVGEGGNGAAVQRQRLSRLQSQLAERQGKYSNDHPEVRRLKREIAEVERAPLAWRPQAPVEQPQNPAYINLLTNIQATANQISALKLQRTSLEDRLEVFRQRLEETPKVEQEYLALQRDYQNAHAKHQEVMNKIMEARIAEGLEEAQKAERFTLIDPAGFPERPVSPNRGVIFLVGLILSLCFGVVSVALIEHLDHSIKSAEELSNLAGLPVLGRIARIQTAEELRRKTRQRLLLASLGFAAFSLGLVLFHFLVLDLWILAAKVWRPAAGFI